MITRETIERIFPKSAWLLALFAFAMLAGPIAASAADDLVGQPSVIDGDTLDIHGQRIRLSGIDAPESSQSCRGADSKPYRCGQEAANEIASFINRRPVSCIEVDRDRYKRAVAVCTVAGIDLADWLVRQGLAVDWPLYSKGGYAGAQQEAVHAERGLWAGSFVTPWDYRRCVRAGGRPEPCSDDASPVR